MYEIGNRKWDLSTFGCSDENLISQKASEEELEAKVFISFFSPTEHICGNMLEE